MQITHTAKSTQPVKEIWENLIQLDNAKLFMPLINSVTLTSKNSSGMNAERICTIPGSFVKEAVTAFDPNKHKMSISILEMGNMPKTKNCAMHFSVHKKDTTSVVTVQAEYDYGNNFLGKVYTILFTPLYSMMAYMLSRGIAQQAKK